MRPAACGPSHCWLVYYSGSVAVMLTNLLSCHWWSWAALNKTDWIGAPGSDSLGSAAGLDSSGSSGGVEHSCLRFDFGSY